MRIRTGPAGSDSKWGKNKLPIIPYGLWIEKQMPKKNCLLLVEGESDCWTLWHNRLPALGIPGAKMSNIIELSHVQPFSTVVIWQEPDDAGITFVEGCICRLQAIKFEGEIKVIQNANAKDPNALYNMNPAVFKIEMNELIKNAVSSKEWVDNLWDDPIPFQEFDLNPLPADILSPWGKTFISSLAAFTQTPACMGLMLFLSALATAVSNKV